jgi:hypothetical protein
MNVPKTAYLSDEFEVRDEVYKLISHLHAQALLICGEGMINFSNHNEDVKNNYMWSICDLAERSLGLLGTLSNIDHGSRKI